jgi:alpha-beta hydrolase superfamily lysophospholipase
MSKPLLTEEEKENTIKKEMAATLGANPGSFVHLSAGRTHYSLQGPAHGQLVVLCHGFGVFSFCYTEIVAGLVKEGYRVLTFDWYAHGYSSAPDPKTTSYNADTFVKQFVELLTELGLQNDPIYLMGHSMVS